MKLALSLMLGLTLALLCGGCTPENADAAKEAVAETAADVGAGAEVAGQAVESAKDDAAGGAAAVGSAAGEVKEDVAAGAETAGKAIDKETKPVQESVGSAQDKAADAVSSHVDGTK